MPGRFGSERCNGSQRWLSNGGVGAAPGPAEVAFSPNGRQLVVTEKATNQIDSFSFGPDGLPGNAVLNRCVLDADQGLVREHNTKPKRVVHSISLPDLDPVVWVEELYERRQI